MATLADLPVGCTAYVPRTEWDQHVGNLAKQIHRLWDEGYVRRGKRPKKRLVRMTLHPTTRELINKVSDEKGEPRRQTRLRLAREVQARLHVSGRAVNAQPQARIQAGFRLRLIATRL